MSIAASDTSTVTEYEAELIARANASTATPVVFVHGLFLLPSSWERWDALFEEAGYVAVAAGWPDDPETVEEAREHPEIFAAKTVGEGHGHALSVDAGWREVAETALAFVQRFA